jgi:hypothetical protein
MSLSLRQRLGIAAVLALVMLATRINHFTPVPDASWALFFAGGFYLRGLGRWAFPAFMALAVAIDAWVITAGGQSFFDHYCMSAAYWFLVPSYAAMWFGGLLLARNYRGLQWRAVAWLAATLLVSASACYLLSNGSFYWLSDTVTNATFGGWAKNLGDWYLPYLRSTAMYVAGGAVVHVVVALLARERVAAADAVAR